MKIKAMSQAMKYEPTDGITDRSRTRKNLTPLECMKDSFPFKASLGRYVFYDNALLIWIYIFLEWHTSDTTYFKSKMKGSVLEYSLSIRSLKFDLNLIHIKIPRKLIA